MSDDLIKYLIGAFVTIAGAYLAYLGVKAQAGAAKKATEEPPAASNAVTEAASNEAYEQWQKLLEPMQSEIQRLRVSMEESDQRLGRALERSEKAEAVAREANQRADETNRMLEQVKLELLRWKAMTRSVLRWAIKLREEVVRLGGTLPPEPDGLETFLLVDEADDARQLRQLP